MHVMYENNERYDRKTARWIQKNNATHVNPNHKGCMKKFWSKTEKLKIFQFRSIEHRSNTNRVRQDQTKNFNRNFDRSKNTLDRSKIWKT